MAEDLNVLILSCGTRNKIVQYFKEELAGKGMVVATDCSRLAPALYEADKYIIVPRFGEKGYLDHILSICRDYHIKAVFTLIDPELSLLAENRQAFLDIGTLPIVSDPNVVAMSFDKYKMFQFLIRHDFRTAKSYIDARQFSVDMEAGKISFPVYIKPVKGSASINNNKVSTMDEVKMLCRQANNLMIQEFMKGREYGVDVYVDMISGELVSLFIKEKLQMRAGETDKSVSIKDGKLVELLRDFVTKAGYRGILDIDIFEVDGEYYISEVNPRFGGGFLHAYECGVNVPGMIVNNMRGIINEESVGDYEENVYMMKFNEVKIIRP